MPQILKLLRSGSARGLSLASYLLDTASVVIVVAYNARQRFPFSTYGENLFIWVQNAIIMWVGAPFADASNDTPEGSHASVPCSLLIIAYSHGPSKTLNGVTFLGATAAASYALFSSSVTSVETLRSLLALSIPLSLSSKLPQIATIWQSGSTGQLSAFLVFNSLAGTLARVFTTATETGDRTLWWAFVSASALNAVIAGQMLWYWGGGGSSNSREGASRSRTPLSQSASTAAGKVAAAADRVSEKMQEKAQHASQPVLGEPVAVSSSSSTSTSTSSNLAPSVAATPAKPASNVGVNPRSIPRSAGRSASTRYTRKVD